MIKPIAILFLLVLPLLAEAQINIGNKVRSKVNQRVNNKVDKAIDEALDDAEGKNKKKETATETAAEAETEAETEATSEKNQATANSPVAEKAKLSSFSKFDFVPGEKVIFYDDLSKSRLGEFPDFWLTNGMGQTVKLNQHPGQWLEMSRQSRYAPDKKFSLPSDYTIEFDLIMNGPKNASLGYLDVKLVNLLADEDNPMAAWKMDHTSLRMIMGFSSSSFAIEDNKTKIHNTVQNNALFSRKGQPMHVAIAVNGTRYRLWIDEQKVLDIPQLLPKDAKKSHLFLDSHLNSDDPEFQMYLTNFRVAEGRPDLRKELNASGKFVTRGITFDSGSDKLKPESYGVIREIANVLQEEGAMRVRIVGHTDSDGNAASNLELSKKRALAIKTALVSTYNIDGARLETDGKGASVPVDNNNTAEGKANNRRAEFIKL